MIAKRRRAQHEILAQPLSESASEATSSDTCEVHPTVTLVKFCPACRASQGGKRSSDAKTAAAKKNGAKGAKVRWGSRSKSKGKASRRGRRSVASR